jgi:hypothetical protein
LSDEALQASEMLVPVAAETVTLPGTVGGDVSGGGVSEAVAQGLVLTVTAAVGERFPVRSYASTPRTELVPQLRPAKVYVVVDVDVPGGTPGP